MAIGLQQFFEHKHLLLILDNCEHLVSAVADVRERRRRRTARRVGAGDEPRGARGSGRADRAARVARRCRRTTDANAVLASEAGALFAARARSRGVTSSSTSAPRSRVHALCARLDGIPLALELAAAQTAMMTPTEIERRLDQQFRLCRWSAARRARASSDPARRDRLVLRPALTGSPAPARPLLGVRRRVRPRRGHGDRVGYRHRVTATASTCSAELVAKSLVERHEVNGATRYRLLEMIRQYAAEQLNGSGDATTARDLHAAHYLARTVELVTEARTDAEYEVLETLGARDPQHRRRRPLAARRATSRRGPGDVRRAPVLRLLRASEHHAGRARRHRRGSHSAARAPRSSRGSPPRACSPASCLFVQGDMERYQRLADLARSTAASGISPTSPICDSVTAMFAGTSKAAASIGPARRGDRACGSDPVPTRLDALALRGDGERAGALDR